MPGWAKALIVVLVLGVLLVVGVVVAGVFWWSNNKDVLIGKAKAVVAEGEEAGRKTDNQGCVDQSVTRYKTDPGFTNGISSSIYLQSCLQTSRPTPGFCDEVPKETEFIKSGQWQLAQCEHVGLGSDQYCRQLFQSVERFCGKPRFGSNHTEP